MATGSRVTLYYNGQKQVAEQHSNHGFLSSSADKLHFGLGKSVQVDSVIVRWPDLSMQVLRKIKADGMITLEMKDATAEISEPKNENPVKKLFSPVLIPGLEYLHREDDWVDYYREKLIPHSLSAEGPALAKGDINGDGLQDLFVGGSKGNPGKLFVQQTDGSFKAADLLKSAECFADEVDAVFFDADGDGDQDLYIARGGNELLPGNPFLADLLFINDGKGNYSRGTLPLFSHNASTVQPCDYDSDGDIDLFIGSRSVPGSYGISPEQYLLENDGSGHFKNVTDTRGAAFRHCGMVTDAEWLDYDNDKDMDLAIAGEWMNVTLYNNNKGIFSEVTLPAGLDKTSGWWNCLQSADIDGDGDIDLIGGNLGLNSLFKGSVSEPVEIYLNDFDNNGSVDPVICTYWNGKSYPFAALDDLSSQIASLASQFKSYSDFGYKTVKDIFGIKAIDQSTVKKAVMFESCLFLNMGNGTFETIRLPEYAQFSAVRDIRAADCNKDGKTDLILAGNNYEFRPSYGRFDASFGWYLINEDNVFKTLLPVDSGLRIDGDARKIVLLEIKGKTHLISAVNNGKLQISELEIH